MPKTRRRNSRRTDRRISASLTEEEYNFLEEFSDQIGELLIQVAGTNPMQDYEQLMTRLANFGILYFHIGEQYILENRND